MLGTVITRPVEEELISSGVMLIIKYPNTCLHYYIPLRMKYINMQMSNYKTVCGNIRFKPVNITYQTSGCCKECLRWTFTGNCGGLPSENMKEKYCLLIST